jgi:hypothetical protein
MVLPSDLKSLISPQMIFLELGSNPDDGSSKNKSYEFPIDAQAKQVFLLFPPDNYFAFFPCY